MYTELVAPETTRTQRNPANMALAGFLVTRAGRFRTTEEMPWFPTLEPHNQRADTRSSDLFPHLLHRLYTRMFPRVGPPAYSGKVGASNKFVIQVTSAELA